MATDVDLMVSFQQGDRESFEKLVRRHQVGLFNFFHRLLFHNRELAEDLTQEVFFRLYLHAGSYVATAKFTTYLYRIARNCWIDHVRKAGRRGTHHSLDVEDEDGGRYSDRFAGREPEPLDVAERNDAVDWVNRGIETLPEEQRLVFVLGEIQGMKYADIGETLNIPVGTVKSRMHVAVQRLRKFLTRHGIEDRKSNHGMS